MLVRLMARCINLNYSQNDCFANSLNKEEYIQAIKLVFCGSIEFFKNSLDFIEVEFSWKSH